MKQTNDSGSGRIYQKRDVMRKNDEMALDHLKTEVELAKVKMELAEERYRHFETLMRECDLWWRVG